MSEHGNDAGVGNKSIQGSTKANVVKISNKQKQVVSDNSEQSIRQKAPTISPPKKPQFVFPTALLRKKERETSEYRQSTQKRKRDLELQQRITELTKMKDK